MHALRLAARHGRLLLVAGLLAGFAAPGLAQAMKPALPAMVAFLVFVSALRIGLRAALGRLGEARDSLWLVLLYQLGLPLLVLATLAVLAPAGATGTAAALAVALALAAPSISGGAAFTVMLGHDPAPAMRLLVLGTLLLPLTILPVFWLLPALEGLDEVLFAALRLSAVIALATGAAFALRRRFFPAPQPGTVAALDGLSAITLAVIVVGLMSAVGPALRTDPGALARWLGLAVALNFGMQAAAFASLRALGRGDIAVPAAVVAGNRNIALFLVALPAEITESVLIFIGCYQVPMYLTPILMQRLYGRP